MKTIEELDVELTLLKIDIDRQQEMLDGLNKRKRDLLISISNVTINERRKAERKARNAVSAARQKAQRLANEYDIEWDDDSYREFDEYNHVHYFPQPTLLEGDDPLKDGHYANNWYETLWLVEFYAKHHPKHPDHEHREYLEIAPHC